MGIPKKIDVTCDRCGDEMAATWNHAAEHKDKTLRLPDRWKWSKDNKIHCPSCQVAMAATTHMAGLAPRYPDTDRRQSFEDTVYRATKEAWKPEE